MSGEERMNFVHIDADHLLRAREAVVIPEM